MAIQGLRDSGILDGGTASDGGFVADQRPLDWRTGILMLYPNGMAPLVALTSQMKKKTTSDPQFHWWDKELNGQRYALVADMTGAGDVDFAISIADSKMVRPGHVMLIEQSDPQELVHVTDVNTATGILTVTRAFAGTTEEATLINFDLEGTNPYLLIVGSVFEEGSSKPNMIAYDPVKRTNYTQIFRWNIGMTRTAAATTLRTGDAIREAKREALEMHSIEMERAFWFGAPDETVQNGRPMRTTGGFFNWVDPSRNWTGASGTGQARAHDFGVSVTIEELEVFLKDAFEYGSSQKVAFCGNRALLTLNQLVRMTGTYNIYVGEKEYGMNVTKLICPFGELILKTHPLWNQTSSGLNPTTPGTTYFYSHDAMIAIVDMGNLSYRPLTGGDTKYIPKQEVNGDDGMESGFLTEAGMEFAHPKTHAIGKNLHTAA